MTLGSVATTTSSAGESLVGSPAVVLNKFPIRYAIMIVSESYQTFGMQNAIKGRLWEWGNRRTFADGNKFHRRVQASPRQFE